MVAEGFAEVGIAAAAAADSLVEPVGKGRLAVASNIFIRLNEIMK